MRNGVICTNEVAKASNNILPEFCNFNDVFSWNKTSGGSNANIINNIGGRRSYYGIGAVEIEFIGTAEVAFNSGGTQTNTVIQRDGRYLLSYAFDKTDVSSDITYTVNVYVNGTLFAQNTIVQNLYNTSGFEDGLWNCYFQSFDLEYGDVVSFGFIAQSDTIGSKVYLDRFKLEIDDRGSGLPTIYTEAPLAVIEEENTITVGLIPTLETVTINASITGAKIADSTRRYVLMVYPLELITLGLVVSEVTLTADNVAKFTILNPTSGDITPTPSSIYNLKIIR